MSRTYISKQISSILLGLFIATILYAEPSFASHENIPLTETFNIYNGLSDDTVNDVLSDSRGFIWIATYKGLIFADSELDADSTIRNFRIVQIEGSRNVSREVMHYNLQMIIAVGFKVNNERAVQLRK